MEESGDVNQFQPHESVTNLVPSNSTANNNLHLNKIIIIIVGRFIGLKGKATNITKQGW